MKLQTGNLSSAERFGSGILGLALPLMLGRRGGLLRPIAALAGAALVARAVAGHCGVKAAMSGHSSLRQGLLDQWRCVTTRRTVADEGLPGSPAHLHRSGSVDDSIEQSFPASDPPASHRPDEPPANAAAKWAAGRAADPTDD